MFDDEATPVPQRGADPKAIPVVVVGTNFNAARDIGFGVFFGLLLANLLVVALVVAVGFIAWIAWIAFVFLFAIEMAIFGG